MGAGPNAVLALGRENYDDFLIERDPGVVHVINAPSPAATASLAIAAEVTDQLITWL